MQGTPKLSVGLHAGVLCLCRNYSHLACGSVPCSSPYLTDSSDVSTIWHPKHEGPIQEKSMCILRQKHEYADQGQVRGLFETLRKYPKWYLAQLPHLPEVISRPPRSAVDVSSLGNGGRVSSPLSFGSCPSTRSPHHLTEDHPFYRYSIQTTAVYTPFIYTCCVTINVRV